MASARCELPAAWTARQRRRALRDGAVKVQITERASRFTTTRTITTWHHGVGKASFVAREAKSAASGAVPAQQAAQCPGSSPSDEHAVMRGVQNSRQRRAAERSARHHKRKRLLLWRKCICAALVVVRLLRSSSSNALRDGRPGSSKRTRDEQGTGEQLLLTGQAACEPAVVGAALQTEDVGSPAPKRAVGPGVMLGLIAVLSGIVLL